ncbi:MAG: hypothetical protein FWD03_01200 [Defluviitaleaceae bacterium]|nr:hypothetical protein [Defluviitaleaceae bacterium]
MQWNNAKNLMLVFFVLVNVLLFVIARQEASGHTLTRERENAIQMVFAQNNINMYHPIPRHFAPMRPLRIAGYDYDIDRLLLMFFPPGAVIAHTEGINRDEFVSGDRQLVISHGDIFFISGLNNEGTPDQDAAIALTQAFIREHYPDFRLDTQSTRVARRGGLRIFYRQEYQGHLIHTSFVEFLVTGQEDDLIIEEVDIHYGRSMGFAYMYREIAGPDEALLTFVQNIRRLRDDPVLITNMDIAFVYFQNVLGSRDAYTSVYAYPFYRIFIEGQDEPFLINAYSNQMQ